jgi:hypothetical protein
MNKLVLIMALVVAGCSTVKVERVEVPVPYWSPPQDIKELPHRKQLETQKLTPEQAAEDTRVAFRAVAEDLRYLLEENETMRHLYEELVKLCKERQESP